jgi:uroporphyrinogen III methyltransferase/synthase
MSKQEPRGKVYLVGAGPGDPGLITLKGLRCLEAADVVVHDRLIDQRLLDYSRPNAQITFAGKGPGEQAMDQDEINRYLVSQASEGKLVVRLKGGDPFVFGRGGEEAMALAEAGITFEVVPGVTSASAVPAYAGIPLTHRGVASSFTVVTGSETPTKSESVVQWEHIARSGGTLVLLMSWASLEDIARSLIDHGVDPATPAALIQWGTEPYQQTVTGTIKSIVQDGKEAGFSSPMVAIVGAVVGLRAKLRWYDAKDLFGVKVLVTRARTQASTLCQALLREGSEPVEVQAIHIAPTTEYACVDSSIAALNQYSWVVFTSVNGVEIFFHRMKDLGMDARALGGVKVVAVGSSTAEALGQQGITPDLVPQMYQAQAVVDGMRHLGLEGSRILLPCAQIGGGDLIQGLESLGAMVDKLSLYDTWIPESSGEQAVEALESGTIDVVTFTSSSTVRNLVALLDGRIELLGNSVVACIGPVTAKTARELGLHVDVVALVHTVEGLVSALKHFYREKRG